MKITLRKLLAIITIATALSGCCFIDKERLPDEDLEDKPWNERSDWENTVPGMGQ